LRELDPAAEGWIDAHDRVALVLEGDPSGLVRDDLAEAFVQPIRRG
jgi:hypothetical protein